MKRKDFIKKGVLGTAVLASGAAAADIITNNIDELKPLDILGFNHIKNTESKVMDMPKR